MNEIDLLLKAYYETLYKHLDTSKDVLAEKIERLLTEEITKRSLENFDKDKYSAYRDACLAFVDERIESYNPFGIQYTFDHTIRQQTFELELQLNWYDSTEEFEQLLEAARLKTETEITEQRLQSLADELIKEFGAFPDRSIISAYEAEPALNKLPDYILARAIEETIGQQK
ncbi:MAG: hypothetical protein MUP16_12215 [Sedimentisphaerales bacterium]|nr:hypothetical protein [Sedimentisphaerales bacterium]